jgi:tRNA(Ile2) C34 agmatinyltransferase TiaS
MPEAWIQLQCAACGERWESSPSDLPAPGQPFTCKHCEETRPTSEFMKTKRDLEILEEFKES